MLPVAAVVAATAGPIRATVITAFPVDFAAPEQSLFSGAVATFEDDNPAAGPADFTATIDWGDGSPTSAGTIGFSSAAFIVLGSHTYADEGSFTVTVTIADVAPGTGTATATDTATITEADVLSGTPTTFAAPSGVSFTRTVATFSDTLTTAVPSDFTATIDWGDATTSAGTVTGGAGSFAVSGTHTYASPGNYPVMVTLSDDAPGTATATVTSTAQVSAGLLAVATGFSTPEGSSFSGAVATFSDANTAKTAADFTVTITWGDGTSSAGTVVGASGSFTVSGTHTYADEGSFGFTVTVTENGPGGATSSSSATATVTEADVLSGTPVAIAASAMVPFTGTVATFTDTYTGNVPGDFTATIDWGDASTSAGTVTGGGGSFSVTGTHTYATPGSFSVTVTLSDDAPGTATATVSSPAIVAAAPIAAVPTLGEGGLAALAALMAAAAMAVLWARRRRALRGGP
ncbi:MAG: hypothetical protein ACM3OB_11080 [Acidobacteriota bacterium]